MNASLGQIRRGEGLGTTVSCQSAMGRIWRVVRHCSTVYRLYPERQKLCKYKLISRHSTDTRTAAAVNAGREA